MDKESGEDSAPDAPQRENMSQVCLGFCWTLLQERDSKNKYSNVLTCGLAVLGVPVRGGR